MEQNNDMNKDMMEREPENEQNGSVVPEYVSAVPAASDVTVSPETASSDKKTGWGAKAVTRKFIIIALAVTVIANAALSAGMMALFAKNNKNSRPDFHGGPGPQSGFFSDDDRSSGQMPSPPGDMQNGSAPQNQDQGDSKAQSSKASIGIVIKDDNGVYVSSVTGDNAKKAGFQEGDKIVSFDGKDVSSSSDLISQVQTHKAGDKVKAVIERDGQSVEISTELE